MNTAPHVLVEGFRYQNPATSVLIVISRCLCTSQEELPVVCGTGASSMSLYPDQHHTRRNHYVRHPYRRLAAVQIEVNRFRASLHICQ